MYPVSQRYRENMAAGEPQRIFFIFQGEGTTRILITNEDISVDAGVTVHETWCNDRDITVGNCGSSEINFVLLNDDRKFNDFTFGRFEAYLGVRYFFTTATHAAGWWSTAYNNTIATVSDGKLEHSYDLMPLGVYTGPRPNVVDKNEITVSSNDYMVNFDVDMPSRTALGLDNTDLTALNILQAMCTYIGVELATTSFLNSGVTLSEWPDDFESCTMRDVLGWIAELACSNAMFNRKGKLELRWVSNTGMSYDESAYLDHAPYWYTTPPVNDVVVRNTLEGVEVHAGVGTNAYLIQDNPFVRG